MRVQVLSDLHLETRQGGVPPLAPGADAVLLAGDLGPAKMGFIGIAAERWAAAGHILYVPGNHEYYGSRIGDAQRRLALDCAKWGVTLLDRAAVTVGHVRFIGATLWTDFRLDGEMRELYAHDAVGRGLRDFCGAIRGAGWKDFTTWEALHRHRRDRAFIEEELERAAAEGLTAAVVTHHAPSPRSIHERYAGDACNPGFASDLESLIRRFRPALWVHGHVHDAFDYTIGETRVLANPRGYRHRREWADFTPDLVVEL